MTRLLWAIIKTLCVIFLAPPMAGWVKWLKFLLQNRRGAPPWQPYRDLLRLSRKTVVIPDSASWIFRMAPASSSR
jgi:formate hydrogenlyase subunit 4